ncbi:Arylsulfotransferase-domain-containing protein [Xylariaceae sp. FL0804]|nr:Arylsulfotransferase-domain-containing protein [Xylariaceae sp. FL0804]
MCGPCLCLSYPTYRVRSQVAMVTIRVLPLVIALLSLFAPACRAQHAFSSTLLYNLGFYGLFPRTWYKSFDLGSPLLNFLQWDVRCENGYYLLAPRGSYVENPGPVILDARGNLVWTDDQFGMVTDVQTQMYKGKQYLTFWAGHNSRLRFGYGMGKYYMLDQSYNVFKVVEAVGEGFTGDMHEFHISDADTALMTSYHAVSGDLSPVGGPKEGWIQESMFQEINIETGELIFEWKASEHVPLNHTVYPYSESSATDNGLSPPYAFDFFHINSVDKDDEGNYIISSRHLCAVMCLSPTGEPIWTLGGPNNMFNDLSEGRATDFRYQHHARLHENNTITLFDNNHSNFYSGDRSRGMIISVDTSHMTAKLENEYIDTTYPQLAESQGSMQTIENTDNVLVGFGFLPAFTEFSSDGEVLCDARFASWIPSHTGMVNSYRTFKTTSWVGRPSYPPSVFLRPSEGTLFASWNGATEIDRWVLQGGEWDAVHQDRFEDIDQQKRDGFEVAFPMDGDMPAYLRVAAVAADGEVLGHTEVVNRSVGNAPKTSVVRDVFITMGVCVVALLVLAVLMRRTISGVLRLHNPTIAERLNPAQMVSRWRNRRKQPGRAKAHELQPLYED